MAVMHTSRFASKKLKKTLEEQNEEIRDAKLKLKYLLDRGANINICDRVNLDNYFFFQGDRTAFFTAVHWEEIDIARFLFNYHPDVDVVIKGVKNNHKKQVQLNALATAMLKENLEMIIFLTIVCKADEELALVLYLMYNLSHSSDDSKTMIQLRNLRGYLKK